MLNFYVSADTGSDSNNGTSLSAAFATVTKCASAMSAELNKRAPGVAAVTCWLAAGVYRESVLYSASAREPTDGPATAFRALGPGARLSGLTSLNDLAWTRHGGADSCIFSARLEASRDFEQLFYGGAPMVEARWPNVDVHNLQRDLFSRSSWQPTNVGSRYGKVVDPALAQFNFSWTGALATLQARQEHFAELRALFRIVERPGSSFLLSALRFP